MRAIKPTILSLFVIVGAACGPSSDYCPPDAEGCYCSGNVEDVALCQQVDPTLTAFCCVNNGGKEVDCGQPADCVPKPGINDPGSSGANWCCPSKHAPLHGTDCDRALDQLVACGVVGARPQTCGFTPCEAACVNTATCEELADAFGGAPARGNRYLDCYDACLSK